MNLVHIKYKAFSEVFNKRFFLALPFFFFLFLNGSKAQTIGSTITFEAGVARTLIGASTNPSVTNIDGHGLGVSAVTAGNIVTIVVGNSVPGITGGSDLAVIMQATGTNVTSFSYKSDNSANNFSLTSFAFAVATGTTQSITVQGYDNGSAVSGAITKTISSPGVTNFTVTSGDVSASSGWGNIDEIRITMNTPAPANFAIDDVLLAAAVASNNAPTASSFTANPSENLTYTFSASDFGYSDGDGDPLSSVLIEALPTNGTLYLDADNDDVFDGGEAVSVSQQISVANINAGNLQYIQNGSSNTSFQFEVNDGTENSSGNYIATLTMRAVPTVTLSITPTSKSESITTASIVTATLSNAYGANTTVNLSFSGSATGSGVDYTISSSSITVGAGNTTNSIVLTNVPDALYEGNETVIIDISSVSNGTENGTQQRTFTIIDDDSQPNVTLEVLPIYNPITDESGGQAYIRGKIDAIAGTTVTIPLSFSGTATGGGTDYSLTGTTITLSPGEIMDSVRVTSQFDGIEEGSETIIVDMGAPTNAVESGSQQVTITINDEDATYPSTTITTGAGNPTNSSPFSVTITFSESVTGFAVGDITVSNGSAGNFAGSGTTYTADITPTGDGAVTVDVGAGAAQDAFGNNNTAATQLSRTYDATAPATPGAPNLAANWDTGTSNSDDITFNTQPRFSGSTEANASIKIISSIDGQVGTSTANGSGNWLQTISGTLSEGTHNITFTATDAAGNESAASAALSIVVDTSNPTLSSSSPADDATGVNTSGNITLTFNENIAFGTGNIEVIDETNGSNSFTIDAASPGTQASISGAVLTINPSSNLDLSSNYSVRIAATAIDDIAGNSYAGITNGTALNFGTNNAPTVTVNTGLTLNEGATELIDSGKLNASDTEGGTLTFTITTATTKGTLFIDTNPSNTFNAGDTELVLNATFTKNDIDSDRIRYVSTTDNDISDSFVFKVSDPDGGELTNQTFNITITPVNDAPSATGVPTDITVIEDAASNFDLSAVTLVDPDGDALTATLAASAGTFTATSGGGVTIGGSGTASLTLAGTAANINTYFDTPANIKYTGASNVSGDNAATFTLNANDATVNPQVGSGNIDITAVNDAPTFTIGANQTVAQNAGAQSINSFITTFDDGDAEATQTVQFNITNNTNATLFTSGPAISATGVLTFTPDAAKFGKATISVTISDNGGTANSGVDTSPAQTFDIFVTPTNIKINEVHAGAGPDAEFIEVYNTEANATSLSGLVMVWFNGGDDLAYKDFDLTGSTNANGFYVIGETAFGSKDQDWGASPDLQNGPDAVALYVGSQNDFTGASAPTLDGLVDVIVYGSSDDATLRAALGNPALQVAGDASNSISRSADGTGGFVAQTPSPQVTNDVTSPTVTSVSVPANATYIASQNLDFTVNFSENVTVVTTGGIPQLAITVGSTTRQAVYQSGSGTSGLLFRYVVQSGEADTDGISVGTLAANGGTLKDAATNDANLTLNSVGATTAVLVDAVAPTVTSVSVPANATYIAGQNLDFTVNFSENVTAVTTGGIPQLAVTIGSTTRQAVYQSGSGTSGLLFRYVVQSGEADTDGISVGTLASNGGTLKDAVTNDANLTLNSVGATTAVLVDAVAPTVTSVSVPANATYVAGQNLDFTVNFSENVTVVDAGGTPQLAITIGSTTRQAAYTSGTGTGALLFRYVVQSGDVDTDGISVGTLAANGGTLKDAATNDANLTLNSVGTTTAVLVDAVAPVITSLSLHNGNTFVEIFASEGLYSTNGGSGALEISDIAISISGGSATNPVITSLKKVDGTTDLTGGENIIRVTFTTTGVADGSEVVKIDFADGSSVFDAAGNAASATQSNNTRILNDLIKPSITGVSLAADNSYIDVTFNEGVYEDNCAGGGLQASDFNLSINNGTATTPVISSVKKNDNTVEGSATALSGGETVVRIFFSVTGTPDGAETLEVDLQANAVFDQNGLTADANQTTNNTASLNDKSAPTVTSVTVPSNATYVSGQNLDFTVNFSENLTVVTTGGTPQLAITVGSTTRQAVYTSGSGTGALLFRYTVQAGDLDTDGIAVGTLAANGGTLRDAATNNANLTLNSVGATTSVLVDAVLPTVTSVSVPANATYVASQNLDFTVNFSENVTVVTTGGTPQLSITIGSTTRQAVYQSGSGTSALLFRYVVQSGELDTDGITVGTLSANGGTLKDAATNDANLTLNSVGATTAVLVDGVAPTVINVTSSTSDGTYKVGDQVNVQVVFSEVIYVNTLSQIQLQLETGTLDYYIAAVSGSGTNTLNFTYTVQAGTESSDLDYKATNSLDISLSGTAKDAAGNDAVLTLPAPGAANSLGANKAIVIDGIAPVITSVSSTKVDGSYGLGEVIVVAVTFDEALTVTGIPQLELETGAVDRKVDYSSGTGTNTLTFNYTVQMGDESADLDYKATNALTLNGGTIKDAAGNDATLTLAAPGAANSLGNNKALVVEAFPTVTLSVSNTTIAEAAGTSTITATLSAVSSQDVTVTLAYSGTATSGTDYNNTASTSITVPAGNLSANAAVGITASQDVNPETNETVIIDITGVTKGTENGTQQQTITITDDDTPNVSFTSTTSSGLESVSSANITVDLNIASALTVTVDYTVTGTASSGTDYTLANGTLTFNPADVQETITIAGIVDDAILESNETVIITLSNPSNANLGTNTAHTYTITDNDAAAVTIADVSGAENGGAITLTATLDNAVQGGFTVEVSTADGTATTADSDYTSITSQTLTFAGTAGETQTFTITPTGDTKLEGNETVTISQGNLAATSLSVNITDQATVTINNDDNASVTIADVSGSENGGAITLTATLDNAVQGGFTVDVNTADGSALAASDYTAVTSQTLTFAGTAGETQTFTVTPTDDAVEESTETLTVSMNNLAATALGVTITDNATITLTDDDDNTAPSGFTITISDALIAASETSTTKFTFTGAEVGTTYNYTVSSNNGGTNVTGTGTIATATDEVTISNLSGLNDGTLSLSVTLTDGSSNTSTAQTATSQLDKTAPAAPVVTGVSADSGSSSSDGITSDTTPDVKGTAEANASIEVFVGGNSVGTTTADGSGDWTLAYSGVNPLADGTISVTAKATDAAGNTSAASTAVNVTIDATAPAAPVITSITPDSGTSTTDKITNDQTNLTITGTGEANSQLEITVNGITYSGLPVDGSGNWLIAVGAILGTDGTYPVTATVTDAAGNQSAASAAFSIIYDTTAPAAPTVDLNAASDLGQSNTDNITHYNATDGLMLSGTAEANAAIALSLTYNGITFSGLTAAADGSGNWTFDAGAIVSGVLADGTVNNLVINAQATDAAGNQGVAGTLTVVLDQQMTATLSPADNAIDILPSANLTMAFGEDVFKGTGNITIKKKSDDSIIETIPVSAVTINSGTVTIDPVNLILPPATEFYINIDAGALTDIAGNSYTISNNTDWSFTIIASSVVTSVAVPANNTYKIGDELDFTTSFTLPITITGTPSIPVTIGASTKTANLKAAVNNSSTAIFSYTIAEGDLDTDGIAVGAAINLNGGTIKDQFGTDAQLALNNVAATTSINVDGVRPVPTLTASTTTLVNGSFTVEFTFSEAVTGFTLADITVANGTASNLATITAGTKWSAEITPTADGTVSASLAAGVANDNAGNASAAGTAVSKTYDGTAPTALSLTRKTANPILTASAGFRVIFSEDVTGVDLTDFEVILTGTATGTLNAVTQVDAKTYDVTVTGISGQGSIGLNLKDDDSIIDAANNPLSGALTGEVYVTNMLPTDIALAPSAIDENNALSAEVGTLSTTDTDATDTHTYSLIAGTGDTDNGSFMVAGNKLFAGAAFNHEVKDSYSIRLQTEDNNGGRFEKAFTITINDVNEAPTDMSLSNNIIDEADDAGVLVGTMASVDQDAAETFTYTLATGTGDDNNLLFTFTGDELRTATPINFETNTTLSIRVKVTDSGGLSYEEVFSITVNNVELEEIRDFTKDAPDARIKNFFSPNGDGVNDVWVVEDILDNPINEVKVFSQNGTLIFSERNYKNTWDGTYKGEAIPPGTYYYEINVYNGEQIVRGFLTIIRTKN